MIFPQILLFGISGGEILILLLIILLLFGPKKIPEIARMVGRGMNEVKKVQREINSEIHRYSSTIENEVKEMDPEADKSPAGKAQKMTENKEDEGEMVSDKPDEKESEDSTGDEIPYPYRRSDHDEKKDEQT
ncbi:MAG: twin-arginine translocase TatA/TatE family subunit [Bacteroidia bacterium]|nr:MAG: twin-arginine translocase TatA/TatE family subunit [Bacteroidia bacterium]